MQKSDIFLFANSAVTLSYIVIILPICLYTVEKRPQKEERESLQRKLNTVEKLAFVCYTIARI